jgi:hypothetical protein
MVDHVRFSVQWINHPTQHTEPMSSCRVLLRDAGGDAIGQSPGGLTCGSLFLDQVIVELRPASDIAPSEFQAGDDATRDWWGPTTELYVRTTPGRRTVGYVLGGDETSDVGRSEGTLSAARARLVYTASLHVVPDAYGTAHQRTFRPLRDLPVATHLQNVSELTIDLLWPLLQADKIHHPTWYVPDYRINRVVCEFTARV